MTHRSYSVCWYTFWIAIFLYFWPTVRSDVIYILYFSRAYPSARDVLLNEYFFLRGVSNILTKVVTCLFSSFHTFISVGLVLFFLLVSLFLVQELIFCHFWNCKKWNFWLKNSLWIWFTWFHEFFGLQFFKFSGPCIR